MEDTQTVKYALVLKIYQQKGSGHSMKKFCEEESRPARAQRPEVSR